MVSGVQFVEKPLHIDPFEKGDCYEDPIAKDSGLDVRISFFPVDHDVPGACCFFVIAENSAFPLLLVLGSLLLLGVQRLLLKALLSRLLRNVCCLCGSCAL